MSCEIQVPTIKPEPVADKQDLREASSRMNAISRGLEARLDQLVNYSEIVTEGTIGTARKIGIPEKEIQLWAKDRVRIISGKTGATGSTLDEVKQSLLAKSIKDATKLLLFEPDLSESPNNNPQ